MAQHLCDAPNGQVIVASSRQWVEAGQDVTVRGPLSLDRDIAGAYIFPLFIEDARLEGDGLQASVPGPVFDL